MLPGGFSRSYLPHNVARYQLRPDGNCAQSSNENTGLRAIVSNIERKKMRSMFELISGEGLSTVLHSGLCLPLFCGGNQ